MCNERKTLFSDKHPGWLSRAGICLLGVCLLCVRETPAQESVPLSDNRSHDLTARIFPLHDQRLSIRGSASCAAVACHGGPQPGVSRGNDKGSEYLQWLEHDPHAHAAIVLHRPDSLRMMARLGIMRDGRIVDRIGYNNCLGCHSPLQETSASPPAVSGGIGCESCHGRGEYWVAEHHRSPRNRELPGMLDTRDLLTRARLCADCHVGSAQRNVNHDMLAAGHPALRFEMVMYHNALPKHWREEREPVRHAELQNALWAAGQIATSEASLALLSARADMRSTAHASWPEFAEYNCGACHHALRYRNVRSTAAVDGVLPAWGDWSYTWLRQFWEPDPHTGDRGLPARFVALENAMVNLANVSAADVADVRRELNVWAARRDRRELAALATRSVRRSMTAPIDVTPMRSREAASQFYLAILGVDLPIQAGESAEPAFRESASARLKEARRTLQSTGGFLEAVGQEDAPLHRFHELLRQYSRERTR